MTKPEAPVVRGEEFRDQERPARRLPAAELSPLTALAPARSVASLAWSYGGLALCIGLALAFWTPWVVIPCVLAIACFQHSLAIISHEATHYRLFESRAANDLVGRVSGMLIGVSTFSYRIVHRLHHNHLYQSADPDIALMAGYPRGKAYLAKKLLKDLAGLTAPLNYAYFFGAPGANLETGVAQRPLDDTTARLRNLALSDRWVVVAFHVFALGLAIATGWWLEYLVLWVLPLVTLMQAILRMRAVMEHGAVSDLSSPLTAARTNVEVPWWGRFIFFPHHVNFHIDHHLYPAVPHYKLPALHEALKRHGILEGAEVRSFRDTLKRVFGPRGSVTITRAADAA
ncbi:MAG: fatty acid desaturase family protein [Betaproteobacteria bacterium]